MIMGRIFSYLRDHYAVIIKVFLLLATVSGVVLMFPKEGKFKYEFKRGAPWMHENLIAPFDFSILKTPEELEMERRDVMVTVSPIFQRQTESMQQKISALTERFEAAWERKYPESGEVSERRKENLQLALEIFDTLYRTGIIEQTPLIDGRMPGYTIIVVDDNVATERPIGDFFTIQSADRYITATLQDHEEADVPLLTGLLRDHIDRNIVFDEEKTEAETMAALDEISLSRGMIQTGERIISRGEVVTDRKYQILESLRQAYEKKLGGSARYAGILAGQIILVFVSVFALFLFLYYFRRDVFHENKNIFLILLLIVGMVYLARVIVHFNMEFIYILPVCLIPIIVRVFFDTRLALFVHLIGIIIIGFLVPNSFEFIFLQLFAGIVTILSIARLERRSQFFLTSLMIFITYSIIYTGMTLIQEGDLSDMKLMNFIFFGTSAVLTLFSYPVIFIFEKAFGLLTDVSLMELSNTNNKLLRELALRAPGTFQHSMQVANLAEEAAYAVNGNALLIRTGAMYHDIGKMDVPLYFIENQSTGVNPHDELTYEESAEIVTSHVYKGIELARRYKLPEQIIDFIRTHHGKRKAEYFYRLQKKDFPEEEVDEERYNYPGPNPFSRETAILMMADAVEAASRSLKQPDEESISELVENIIDQQMKQGLFENADITLKDITKIKKIFKKKLLSIFHLRIEYPA